MVKSARACTPGLFVNEQGISVNELSITSLHTSVKTTLSGSYFLERCIRHGLSMYFKSYQDFVSFLS